MTRPLAFAALAAGLALAAAPAAAQTWGQPIYVSPWGHIVGGTPLSEVETRSYVQTGRWADGYSDRPQVYVPARGYGQGGYGGYDAGSYRSGYSSRYGYPSYGYGYGRHYRSRRTDSRVGYRDEWGYNDDRPPAYRGRRDHDCGCGDVYLYDR